LTDVAFHAIRLHQTDTDEIPLRLARLGVQRQQLRGLCSVRLRGDRMGKGEQQARGQQ